MILKQVIHYHETNSVEATWVTQEQLPDTEVPEAFGPTTRNEAGEIIPGELIPAHVVPGRIKETVVRCHSYADVQMDMLREDIKQFGGDVAEYESLIKQVEAGIKPPAPPSPEQLREAAKAARAEAVARIKVTTASGKTFDGDEVSQGRMGRAIIGLQATGAPSIAWVLADNTPAAVTLPELVEALVLAGQAQANMWVIA